MKTKREKAGKIVNIVTDIIVIPVLVFALLFCVSVLFLKGNGGVPNLFGYSFVKILSGSMAESGFDSGDGAVIKKAEGKALGAGEIIAFYRYADPYNPAPDNGSPSVDASAPRTENAAIWFHEIVDVRTDASGTRWYRTKGSSNPEPDSVWVRQDFVLGQYVAVPAFICGALAFLSSSAGIWIAVIVPCVLLLVFLAFQIASGVRTILLERKVICGKLKLTDQVCVARKVGRGMRERDKRELYDKAPEHLQSRYAELLWGGPPKPVIFPKIGKVEFQ